MGANKENHSLSGFDCTKLEYLIKACAFARQTNQEKIVSLIKTGLVEKEKGALKLLVFVFVVA